MRSWQGRRGDDGIFGGSGLQPQLQALIASTARTSDAQGLCDGGYLVIPKRTTTGYLLAEVAPIRDDGFPDSDYLLGTGVFILDPEISRNVSLAGIAAVFDLTPAERAVATALLNGAPLRQIAEERRNSVETIRCHLKNIFAKTGTASQLELMRLAVKANPPIENQ